MTQYIDHNAIVNSNMEKKGCQAGFKKDLHSFFFSKKYIFSRCSSMFFAWLRPHESLPERKAILHIIL